jgi:hypothetical protein
LDESSGLQNAVATSKVGDSNDNDIAVNKLPSEFSARMTALNAGVPLEAAESGYNGVSGSNVFMLSGSSSAQVSNMALTNASGQSLNGVDSGLNTVDGRDIFLYSDSLNDNIVLGKTSGGDIVFAVYLEQTSGPVAGGALWTVLYSPIFHPDPSQPDESVNLSGKVFVTVNASSESGMADAAPGQHLFFMVGDSDSAIVVTGRAPANQSAGAKLNTGDTVNISHGGNATSIGTNNQMIDPEKE